MPKHTENDLWPDDLLLGDGDNPSPIRILQEQAEYLSQKTRKIVSARLESRLPDKGNKKMTCFGFVLFASQIPFSYELFSLEFGLKETYPVILSDAEDFGFEQDHVEASTEKEFLALLRTIFACETTRRVVRSLVEQSKLIQSQAA